MIDVTPLIFYGIVCAVLAATLPPGLRIWGRLAIGAGVGVGGAVCLPVLRASFGV